MYMKKSTDTGGHRAKSSDSRLLSYWSTFQKMVWKIKVIRKQKRLLTSNVSLLSRLALKVDMDKTETDNEYIFS